MDFEQRPRKVHLHWDQEGARMPSHIPGVQGKLYADTLCKGNFAGPELLTTTNPAEVTCQTCLKDRRLQVWLAQNPPPSDDLETLTPERIAQLRKAYSKGEDIVRVVRVLEYVGARSAVERVLQQNAVKGFADFGPVTIREAMLPYPEKLG